MGQFTGKVVLVTGGTSGIGKATALAYAREGAKVVVAGRREQEGNAVASDIRALGGEALFVQADVSREADVVALIEQTLAAYGRLDIAFNNAGVELFGPLLETSEAQYDQVMDINVKGVFFALKHEIEAMLRSGGGAIVNTSSALGQIGMGSVGAYVASKHAVNGLTRSAALEFAKQNIRVNAVAPGVIQTEMFDRFTGGQQQAIDYMKGLHPVGRFGQSEEVVSAVLYLTSDAASFITGQILPIDGGVTAQ